MKQIIRTRLLAAIFILLCVLSVGATPPEAPEFPNFDKRRGASVEPQRLDPGRKTAADELRARIPGLRIEVDEILAAPKLVFNAHGFLTGPDSEEALQPRTVQSPAERQESPDPYRKIKQFLNENAGMFGHGSETLNSARVSREFVTAHNGLKTIVWEQRLDGIPVFEGVLYGHLTAKGELVSLSSQFVPDTAAAANAGVPNRQTAQAVPPLPAREAIAIAATNIAEVLRAEEVTAVDAIPAGLERKQRFTAQVIRGEARASLVWLPTGRNTMRLCWKVVLTGKTTGQLFQVLIDAETGEVQLRHCWTFGISNASYRVFTSDSPSPFSPGHSTPSTTQPSLVSRQLVTLSALSTVASPDGWINDGNNETLGNNVDARLDLDGDDNPDTGSRPQGSPSRIFDFPLNLSQSPTDADNRKSAIVNAFYWCNWMHDRLYDLGFTEAAGNFQQVNTFGGVNRGGTPGDRMIVDVQNGADISQANGGSFNKGALNVNVEDGDPARLELFVFNSSTPDRDGAFDAETIIHEYSHGLSVRRVGEGTGISQLQAKALAEGWSDFMAIALLSESTDTLSGNYAYGAYSVYQWAANAADKNYYFGMRRYPYSTDMAKAPLTFKDIDENQANTRPLIPGTSDPVPLSPGFWGGFPPPGADNQWFVGLANEEHFAGEVWCSALWDARANLITKHGFAGNEIMIRLVVDGMTLCPPNPNFIQARDAILLADRVNNGGANLKELWEAFKKRGMGWLATSPASSTTSGLVESFDLPPTDDVLWSYTTGNAVFSSPAIGADGTIYVGSTDGKLYALNPDGTKKWDFGPTATYPGFTASPTIGPDGCIYARRKDDYLYVLRPDGTLKWSYPVTYDAWSSPAIAKDGTVYIAGYTKMYALDQYGVRKWEFDTLNTIYSSPAIGVDGTVYFGGMNGKLYALNPATGASISANWPFTAGGSIVSSPAIGADGTIYFGSYDGYLYAVNGSTAAQLWRQSVGGQTLSSPAIGSDGSIYIGSDDKKVYSFSSSGTLQWTRLTGWYVQSAPAVAANGTIYVTSGDGKIYALSPANGSDLTGFPNVTGAAIYSSPVVAANGTIYFGGNDSKVYAVRGLSGPARSSWPMFRRTARHISNAAEISFANLSRWPNGVCELDIVASPGLSTVTLEATSDFNTWTSLGTVNLVNGAGGFQDALAVGQAKRFYRASSGNSRTFSPAGYMELTFGTGFTMGAIQLNGTNGTVRSLFAAAPNGTTIQKYDPATATYQTATFSSGAWSGTDFSLNPGDGALVNNSSGGEFKVLIKGEVLQGFLSASVPATLSVRASPTPQSGAAMTLLGITPVTWDQLQKYNRNTSSYDTFTYFIGDVWDPSVPQVAAGEAVWFNTGTARTAQRTFSVWP